VPIGDMAARWAVSALRGAAIQRPRRRSGILDLLLDFDRQGDRKGRALANRRIDPDGSAVHFDD
jgi:hypothetical protein